MFYHANTCKQCSDVLHVGLGHAGFLCSLLLCSLCLPYLCSGRVPYVWLMTVMFSGVFLFEFECDYFHVLNFL